MVSFVESLGLPTNFVFGELRHGERADFSMVGLVRVCKGPDKIIDKYSLLGWNLFFIYALISYILRLICRITLESEFRTIEYRR